MCNEKVAGSNPAGGARYIWIYFDVFGYNKIEDVKVNQAHLGFDFL